MEDQGINPSNFLNSAIFKSELHRLMLTTEQGSQALVKSVAQEADQALEFVIDKCFGKFEQLSSQIKVSAKEELTKLEDST